MKPADLKAGDRLSTAVGTLIVAKEPFVDIGEENARRFGVDYRPEDDRVHVDVEVEHPGSFGDPDRLPEVTGAADFQWLGSTPTLRYRLFFHPTTDVEVQR